MWGYENNRRTMLLSSYIFASFLKEPCIFGSIQKCTKKIKAVKKWPDALLRSTEISQTLPTAVGIKHEKFRPFRSEEHPGGHFFKAERIVLPLLGGIPHRRSRPAINLEKSQRCPAYLTDDEVSQSPR